MHEKIGVAGDGIVVSGEVQDRCEFGVLEVGAEGERTVAGKVPMLESGGGVEFGGGVVPAQNGIVKSDRLEGHFDRGGKRIPVGLEWMSVGRGGEGHVEIFDQQSAGELRSTE